MSVFQALHSSKGRAMLKKVFSFPDTKLGVIKMPPAIEYSVRKQNIKFMHNRNQFSAEYFQFIKKLVSCNPHNINRQNMNEKLVSQIEQIIIDSL